MDHQVVEVGGSISPIKGFGFTGQISSGKNMFNEEHFYDDRSSHRVAVVGYGRIGENSILEFQLGRGKGQIKGTNDINSFPALSSGSSVPDKYDYVLSEYRDWHFQSSYSFYPSKENMRVTFGASLHDIDFGKYYYSTTWQDVFSGPFNVKSIQPFIHTDHFFGNFGINAHISYSMFFDASRQLGNDHPSYKKFGAGVGLFFTLRKMGD
ncbi:MAG: hypothetical protein RIM99_04580 [Cyclobacteriaceae bacterium]